MASIYDVNAAIEKPNFLNSFRQGQQYAQQQKANALAMEQAQQEVSDRNALRQLAPQIIAGDPTAFQQAAAINPEAAGKYEQAGSGQFAKLRNMVDYIDRAKASGNQAALTAALGQAWPYIRQVAPGAPEQPPTAFTPEMEQGWEALKAKVAMAQGGAQGSIQSTYVDSAGNRVAILRDGRTMVLGQNAPTIRVLEQEGALPYGVVTGGGVAGSVVPLGGGQAASAPQSPANVPSGLVRTSSGELVRLDPAMPAADRAAIIAGNVDESGNFQGAPAYQAPVGPVRTPTAGERAAAEAAARRQVELETLPAELGMRTDAAIAQTAGQERVKADIGLQAEQAGKQRERSIALNMYETAMQGLRAGLEGTETGPIVGRIPAVTSGQQTAEGAVAAMAPILKQLFRTAGEGTFTDRDQELLLRMVPTRTDLPAARAAKIENIDRIVRAKLGQAPQASGAASGEPARVRSAADYEALPSGAQFYAPDGTLRRKR